MDELAAAMLAQARPDPADMVAKVEAVNPDGTVTVNVRGASVPLPAMRSYINRKVGDRVTVRVRSGEMVVEGTAGVEAAIPAAVSFTVSDSSAPAGADWQQIVTGQIWARPVSAVDPGGALWLKRVAPYVPPTPTVTAPATLIKVSTAVDTYRGGARLGRGYAEQGDFTGRGLCTGVWTFGSGAWSTLSGKTIAAVRVKIRRRAEGHGFTYGPVPVHLWLHAQTDLPASTPTLVAPEWVIGPGLRLGEEATVAVPPAWGTALQAGTAQGVAMYSGTARENVEAYGGLTVYVDYY